MEFEVEDLWSRITDAAIRRNQDAEVFEEPASCGIDEPHAPGMHAPPVDLESDEEEVEGGSDESVFADKDEDLGVIGRDCVRRLARLEATTEMRPRPEHPDAHESALDQLILAARRVLR
jgi:hypothetical protein